MRIIVQYINIMNIVSAKYGAEEKYTDVLYILKYLMMGKEFVVSNDFFGDPNVGVVKYLVVQYGDGNIMMSPEHGRIMVNPVGSEYPLSLI